MSGIEARLAEVSTTICGKCVAIVADLDIHYRWHASVAEEVTAARAEACEQVAVAIRGQCAADEFEPARESITVDLGVRIARAAAPPSSTEAGVLGVRIEAAIRLVSPEHLTPMGARILRAALRGDGGGSGSALGGLETATGGPGPHSGVSVDVGTADRAADRRDAQ